MSQQTQPIDVTDRPPFESAFITTKRRRIHHWFIDFTIMPLYLTLGFYFISQVIALVQSLIKDPDLSYLLTLISLFVGWLILIIPLAVVQYGRLIRPHWAISYLNVRQRFAYLVLYFFLILLSIVSKDVRIITLIVFFASIFITWPLIQQIFVFNERIKPKRGHVFVFLILLLLPFLFPSPVIGRLVFLAVLGWITLSISNPADLASRQRAYWRLLFHNQRRQEIRRLISPTLDIYNPLYRIKKWINRNINLDNQAFGVILCLLAGGLGVPLVIVWLINDPTRKEWELGDALQLMTIGLVSSAVLITFYLVSWVTRHRQRYIVLPFRAASEQNSNITSMGNRITKRLVEEIQEIVILLQTRKIENAVRGSGEHSLSLFVASGQTDELLNSLQTIGTFDSTDIQGVRFLSGIINLLTKTFSKIEIKGFFTVLENGEVELTVELSRRGHFGTIIDTSPLPTVLSDSLDEEAIRVLCRRIAIKIIMELGTESPFACTWESFDYFLQGLKATLDHRWWTAIYAYNRAIQIEAAHGGVFGYGHYHLGAALIFQGEKDEGLKHLEQAEMIGPPLPETQYMLAMVNLYSNWNKLHINRTPFEDIIQRCQQAILLRPHFPEVYHLLAVAYYRRGRLENVRTTQDYDPRGHDFDSKEIVASPQALMDYRKATTYLRRALRQYDEDLQRLQRTEQETLRGTLLQVLHDRMTAAHRLGDALRSQGFAREAGTYYRDFLTAFPSNIRTLADLSKTYILESHWQQADEFLSREALIFQEARINPDIAIHMGWTLAGGVLDENQAIRIRRSNKHVNLQYMDRRLLGDAMMCIDLALCLRPQYSTRWRQTDWLKYFEKAGQTLASATVNSATISNAVDKALGLGDFVEGGVFSPNEYFSAHTFLWLVLRMHGFGYTASKDALLRLVDSNVCNALRLSTTNKERCDSVYDYYVKLKLNRTAYAKMLTEVDKSRRLRGIVNSMKRLKHAQSGLENWRDITEYLESSENVFPTPANGISFVERWAYDVFAEISLFAVRTLVDAQVCEVAYHVARRSVKRLDDFIELRWKSAYPNTNDTGRPRYTFSRRTIRWQLATLYAYEGYCCILMHTDLQTKLRIDLIPENGSPEIPKDLLAHTEEVVDKALKLVKRHPLALCVQGLLYKAQGRYDDAISEFQRLLQLLAPFDPYVQIAAWQPVDKHTGRKSTLDEEERSDPSSKMRLMMEAQERVCGQRQFEFILNPAALHRELADIYIRLDRIELSIEHLQQAITLSPHLDEDADALLLLVRLLERLDRFEDAQAAIQALRVRQSALEGVTYSLTKPIETEILSCIINSRTGEHSKAGAHGTNLLEHGIPNKPKRGYQDRLETDPLDLDVERVKAIFTELRPHFETYITLVEESKLYLECRKPEKKPKPTEDVTPAENLESAEDSKPVEDPDSPDMPHIVKLLEMSENYLSLESRKKLLQGIFEKLSELNYVAWNELNPEYYVTCRIVNVVLRDALHNLELITQLANNIVYARIELDLCSKIPDEEKIAKAIAIIRKLRELAPKGNSVYITRYNQYLAQYYDTWGWLYAKTIEHSHVKSHYINELKKAIRLIERGLVYDQKRSILHYHLSRIHLQILEYTWMGMPDYQQFLVHQSAAEIEMHLSKAYEHYIKAKSLDINGRLSSRLGRLGRRVDDYRTNWRHRHLTTFGKA